MPPRHRIALLSVALATAFLATGWMSGRPTLTELMIIAPFVVGGTSLLGGESKILGTLIGAFIIAVVVGGMNLMGLKSYPQKVILGVVILGAVLLDQLKKKAVARDLLPRLRQSL